MDSKRCNGDRTPSPRLPGNVAGGGPGPCDGGGPDRDARRVPRRAESPSAVAAVELGPGEALACWTGSHPMPFKLIPAPPRTECQRHRRKYVEGRLPDDRVFVFHGSDGKLNLRAYNLMKLPRPCRRRGRGHLALSPESQGILEVAARGNQGRRTCARWRRSKRASSRTRPAAAKRSASRSLSAIASFPRPRRSDPKQDTTVCQAGEPAIRLSSAFNRLGDPRSAKSQCSSGCPWTLVRIYART